MRCHWVTVLSVFAVASLGGLATSRSPRWDDMRLKHSWNTIPENWECLGLPPAGTAIDLLLALKPHRENALTDALYEVSRPGHPKYGAHLSKEQVAQLVAPHPHTLELVHSWLAHHGVPSSSVSVTHGGSSLTVTGVSVSRANDILGASYQLYRHVVTAETVVRTVGYALPAALHGYVQTVAPTTYFASPRTQRQKPRKDSGGAISGQEKEESGGAPMWSRDYDGTTSPPFLRWLYSTTAYVPTATDRNSLGIVGYGGHCPSPADLGTFMRKYRSDVSDASFTIVTVQNGGYDSSNPNLEANLDTQLAEGMASPTPHIFYSTGLGPFRDWYLAWFSYMLGQRSIPQTISMSYGDDEDTFPREYATFLCSLFAQLGLRGASVLVPSGDRGVGAGDCRTEDGVYQFIPLFPATCPWVTAVGGTTNHVPEIAASFSGGGFSNYFLRPDYQHLAVPTFTDNLGDQYQGLYNISGRGIPDLSAQALNFRLFFTGNEETTFGTSGSTPIVAGIISLLNDHLLSERKAPLGFLNPWLYRLGVGRLNDITSGSNTGCNTDGFTAVDGWDPVTGLGTLDFERLLYILDLADPLNSAN